MKIFFARTSRGLTLVELVIALVVISVIASVGVDAFIQVLRTDRELRARSSAIREAQRVVNEFRAAAANLRTSPVAGILPFSTAVDQLSGAKIYQFLVRAPEGCLDDKARREVQAVVLRYSVSVAPHEGKYAISRTRQNVSFSEVLGEPSVSVVAQNLTQFDLAPKTDGDESESNSNADGAKIPIAFDLSLSYELPWNERFESTFYVPVASRLAKEKESARPEKSGGSSDAAP